MKSITIQSDKEQDLAMIIELAERLNAKVIVDPESASEEDFDIAEDPEAIYLNDDEVFKPMTMEEFNQRIDQSLLDSEEGRVISTEDLLKEIKTW